MASKLVKLSMLGLGFAGWSAVLAGTAILQAAASGSGSFKNYPVTGLGDVSPVAIQAAVAAGLPWNKNPYTGNTNSYGWWIVCFQLVAILYAAFAATAAHGKRRGAARLLGVLTTSTFLYTCDVANAPLGAYAFSHNMSGTPAVVTGKKATLTKNGMFVLFAGLIIVDIANVVLTICLDDVEPIPAEKPAVEEKAEEKAAEAPADAAAAV